MLLDDVICQMIVPSFLAQKQMHLGLRVWG
jgi:hypothetical protein